MPSPARDFVGYGARPPRIRWPDDSRLAISIGINYEEGAEHSLADGPRRELSGEVQSSVPPDMRDLVNESFFEYGSRIGVWRLLRILERHGVRATFFACGLAAERNPEAMVAAVAAGHELCGHGYRWTEHHLMSVDEQREDIRRCVEAIAKVGGTRPVGWLNRYAPSEATRELLAEEGGFLYDSNAFNDDLPYYVPVGDDGRPWLVLPYSMELNDGRAWRGAMVSPREFEDYLVGAFDQLYGESADTAKMMSVGLHCRISGTPGRAPVLDRFLAYAREHEGVWFARRDEIARWIWREHPPESLIVERARER